VGPGRRIMGRKGWKHDKRGGGRGKKGGEGWDRKEGE